GEHRAGFFGDADAGGSDAANLLGRALAALGELAHFGGDHGETLAVLAGARRFDGRVQGQQIGLVGDLLDDGNFFRDEFHRLYGFVDCAAMRSICRLFSAFWVIEAFICSRLALVSSTEAACSLVPWESDWADEETWYDAADTASVTELTCAITPSSVSTKRLKARDTSPISSRR